MEVALTWSIIFIMVGLLLIFLEVFNPGFFIAVPGTVLAILGILGLIAPWLVFGRAAWITIPTLSVLASIGTLWAYKQWAPPGDKPLTLSIDTLPGMEGKVTSEVTPDSTRGKVRISGQSWSATSSAVIPIGTRIKVIDAEGVHVVVVPVTSNDGGL